MSKIISKIPAPVDADGRELSAEEVEELSSEPTYVPVAIDINGREITFHVAADFDQVSKNGDQAYQLLKAKQYKIRIDDRQKKRKINSKYTHLSGDNAGDINETTTEETADEDVLSGDQYIAIVELQTVEHATFIDLVLPSIVGHNVPRMPQNTGDESDFRRRLRDWFEAGGKTAITVLESLVASYDPTGPLAEGRTRAAQQKAMMKALNEKMMKAVETMDVNDVTETLTKEAEPPTESSAQSSEDLTVTESVSTPTPMTPNDNSSMPSPEATETVSAAESSTPSSETALSIV